MAYITLEELKKILPGILDQWIDKDDESWEWIFQEIEQKCHVGKKSKKKKKESMKDAIKVTIMAHRNDIDECKRKITNLSDVYTGKVQQMQLTINDLRAEVMHLRSEIESAKSMAETAKQRTEVDYSKYSGKSDGKISYSNEAKKLNDELNSMTSDDIARWRKEQDSKNLQSCTTCKNYCGDGAIKGPCIDCIDYDRWEAKDE